MIDVQRNILPELDGGAKSLTESIAITREAVNQGIEKIIATPQYNEETSTNSRETILQSVYDLNEILQQENIPVEILPGQEIKVYGNVNEDLIEDKLLPLNENSNYVLIQLPDNHVPQYFTQIIFDMQIAGYKPIVVSPEQNEEFMKNPDKLYSLVKNGALTQIRAESLIGKAGNKVQKFAYQIAEANLAHFVATNYFVKKRKVALRAALKEIERKCGESIRFKLKDNIQKLVDGQVVYQDPPERITKKRKWFLV
ncbi:tyrosine-protein phosphatase [Oceanobacillus salinisoli]|uniref:tyrosine-protein phosphatase n=1 Tax=Oceanobacillus salinisoli TaxID=2678611 RepID=UPI0012E282DF|nr:CpsB/CapC family capsule biosynthesis tyrosine phosphatase [Oceanobacillus salinisoli]